MKTFYSTLALLLLSTTAFAAGQISTEQDLYTCQASKWNSVRIVKKTVEDSVSYALILEAASRDRAAGVGIYLESKNEVVFGLTSLSKAADGTVTFSGDFEGTQPENTSTTKLVGKPKDGSLDFTLVEGPHHVELTEGHTTDSNYSFDFFLDRMNTLLFETDVVENGSLLCTEN